MSSLSFPDLNIWIALEAPGHVHHACVSDWWQHETGDICFTRATQLGFLRLVTTAVAMDGKPLTLDGAWRAYDLFFEDDRVLYLPEPPQVERSFRRRTSDATVSPKV